MTPPNRDEAAQAAEWLRTRWISKHGPEHVGAKWHDNDYIDEVVNVAAKLAELYHLPAEAQFDIGVFLADALRAGVAWERGRAESSKRTCPDCAVEMVATVHQCPKCNEAVLNGRACEMVDEFIAHAKAEPVPPAKSAETASFCGEHATGRHIAGYSSWKLDNENCVVCAAQLVECVICDKAPCTCDVQPILDAVLPKDEPAGDLRELALGIVVKMAQTIDKDPEGAGGTAIQDIVQALTQIRAQAHSQGLAEGYERGVRDAANAIQHRYYSDGNEIAPIILALLPKKDGES